MWNGGLIIFVPCSYIGRLRTSNNPPSFRRYRALVLPVFVLLLPHRLCSPPACRFVYLSVIFASASASPARQRRKEEEKEAAVAAGSDGHGLGRRERGGAHPVVHAAGGSVGGVRGAGEAHPVDTSRHPRLRPLRRTGRRPTHITHFLFRSMLVTLVLYW